MIRHHASDATLLACAAGTLPEPHRRVVAVHAARCPACRARLAEAERIGGVVMEGLTPCPLAADALERVLARLDLPVAEPVPLVAATTLEGLATGRWHWAGPGIRMMSLLARDATGSRLDLLRVAPRTALLEHGHAGFETTCVLQGAFADGIGEYHEGDFAECDGAHDHRPETLPGGDCICIIATSGQLRPHSWLGRVVRPLLGM